MQTRITPNRDTFYAVLKTISLDTEGNLSLKNCMTLNIILVSVHCLWHKSGHIFQQLEITCNYSSLHNRYLHNIIQVSK